MSSYQALHLPSGGGHYRSRYGQPAAQDDQVDARSGRHQTRGIGPRQVNQANTDCRKAAKGASNVRNQPQPTAAQLDAAHQQKSEAGNQSDRAVLTTVETADTD